MQKLGAAERLGMEVAGFLELERSLARDRERRAAADGDKLSDRVASGSSAAPQSSRSRAARRSGSRRLPQPSAVSSVQAATSRSSAASAATKVFVAATLAPGRPPSAARFAGRASGLSVALTTAAVSAPAALAQRASLDQVVAAPGLGDREK